MIRIPATYFLFDAKTRAVEREKPGETLYPVHLALAYRT